MKKISIATDSHSGILPEEAKRIGVYVLPMPFYFEDKCLYEGKNIDRNEFFEKLDSGIQVSTSAPSIMEVEELWDEALSESDELVYIPMSSGLSSSCDNAISMSMEEKYQGRVFVVDNGRVSAPQARSVYDAILMAEKGLDAATIKRKLEECRDGMSIYVAIDNLEHLRKGGRISSSSALLGSVLNIKPVMKFGTGKLDVYKKCRGMKKAKREMLEAVDQDFSTTYKTEVEAGRMHLLAASSLDDDEKEKWIEEIKEHFPGMEVLYGDLSLGLCCHIGRGGIGIAYSIKPDFE